MDDQDDRGEMDAYRAAMQGNLKPLVTFIDQHLYNEAPVILRLISDMLKAGMPESYPRKDFSHIDFKITSTPNRGKKLTQWATIKKFFENKRIVNLLIENDILEAGHHESAVTFTMEASGFNRTRINRAWREAKTDAKNSVALQHALNQGFANSPEVSFYQFMLNNANTGEQRAMLVEKYHVPKDKLEKLWRQSLIASASIAL